LCMELYLFFPEHLHNMVLNKGTTFLNLVHMENLLWINFLHLDSLVFNTLNYSEEYHMPCRHVSSSWTVKMLTFKMVTHLTAVTYSYNKHSIIPVINPNPVFNHEHMTVCWWLW
jgi:hypothetical protein